jgi:PKD repeat protein
LKKKKHDNDLTELFRKKLEYEGIVPDASVRIKLMRKVKRREFLRFNPSRFNIYYSFVILLVAIITAIILSSGPQSPVQGSTINLADTLSKKNPDAGSENGVTEKPDKVNSTIKVSLKNKPSVVPVSLTPEGKSEADGRRVIDSISHPVVNTSNTKKGLHVSASNEKKGLHGGFKDAKILFDVSASAGCTPLKLRFYNKAASFDSCRWTFGDGGYSNEKNPEWIFDVEGEYKVVLNVFGPGGVLETSSSVITVFPKPMARFEIASSKSSLPDDEIRFYNYSSNAIHFKWDFGDGDTSELFEPAHRYENPGNYNVLLMVSSGYGCSDSLLVTNAFSGSEYYISFPNAFIPDNQGPTGGYYSTKSDEAAQVFHPVSSGVSEYHLKIFSKLGILIFESSDLSIGWDGYYKGQMSVPGVYIWKVRGKFRNGEPFIRMGDVTLLRSEL